jgi:hypothetical protein
MNKRARSRHLRLLDGTAKGIPDGTDGLDQRAALEVIIHREWIVLATAHEQFSLVISLHKRMIREMSHRQG